MPAAPTVPGFNLERPLASGRHGAVWAARRRGDDAAVALKLVPAERVGDAARFLREAEALAAIEHPHIIRCLASGQHGEMLWLAMERAAGDLASEMKRGLLAPERLLAVGRDAAAGLAALHGRGLVHRDITPANLLTMPDGRVVLGDFGLIHGGHERLTATGEVLGTPAYLSPEQAAGTPVEARSDVYALGAVLYALATGQPPYQGEGAWGVLALIAKGPFPDPRALRPDLPLELRAIIRAATGLRPEQRYDSVALLGEDCAAVLAGGTPRHAGALRARFSAGEAPPPAAAPRRRGPQWLLFAAAGLLGGLLLGWLIGRPDPAEREAFAAAAKAGDAAAWRAYAEAFPAGAGVAAARRALAVLEQPTPAAGAERLRLERELEVLQAEVVRLGRPMTPPAIPGWVCEEAIGHGADAVVWRARPASGGAAVALKVIPLARLRDPAAHLREAWAAGSTGSRQVVAVHDAGQHGEFAWLAMELAGEDAAMLAARCGGRLKPATAARIARDVARGLQALADHGFVHRDVKPSNILLRADGSAMIGDLAPLRGGGTATRSADLSGTPAYLSPEQIRGSAPDVRSDVHALGATLFALIAGRPPFTGDGALDLLRAIAETPAPDLRGLVPEVGPAIADVVATALAKDPVRRQQRPAQLAAELDEALAGRTPSRAAAPAVRVPPPAASIAWRPYAAAVAAALLGLAIGAWSARPSAQALAEEAAVVAAAVAAGRERVHAETEAAVIATLRSRIDRLRVERERLTHRSPVPAVPVTAPEAQSPAPVPAVAEPVRAEPASPPVVTIMPDAPSPPTAAPMPPPSSPPAADTEPATSLPRIHVVPSQTPRGFVGMSINPLAVTYLVGWDGDRRLWSSGDHGATWSQTESQAPRSTAWSSDSAPARAAMWHGPYGFVPGVGLRMGWQTRDGGRTWQDVQRPVSVLELQPATWPTQRTMTTDGAIHAAGEVSGQRRVWRISTTRDTGAIWRDSVDVKADRLVLHAAGDRVLIAAGSGVWQTSLDLGRTWQDIPPGSYEKSVCCRDPATLRLLSWRGGMSLLDVANGRWSVAAMAQPEGADLTVFAIDPRDPGTAFAADPRIGLIRTSDQGRTWRPCVLPTITQPSALLIVGSRRPRLYCLTRDGIVSLDLTHPVDDLFPVPPAVPEGLLRETTPRAGFAGGFGVEPTRSGAVYAWFGNETWRSQDGAVTWRPLESAELQYANASTRLAATPEQQAVLLQPGTANGIGYLFGKDGSRRLEMPAGRRWHAGPAMTATGRLLAAVWPSNADGKTLSLIASADGGQAWEDAGSIQASSAMLIPVVGEVAIVHIADRDAVAVLGTDGVPIAAGTAGRTEALQRTWFSSGERFWVVDRRWSTLFCFDGRARRWRTQSLGALPAWAEQARWHDFVVDPEDPQRLWVVADGGGLVHSRDGGRTWHWLGVPFQAASRPSIGLLRGSSAQLLVSVPGGIRAIDARAAGSALFTRVLAPSP